MTPEEHQIEHIRLHRALDELLACYLEEGFAGEAAGMPRRSIYDDIVQLLTWAHQKTLVPSPVERAHYGQQPRFLIAQSDDPELLEWLAKAENQGGDFVRSMARAGLVADHENYPLIRLVLMALRRKYPDYEPSEAVKQEIRDRQGVNDGKTLG
jgi:hypothetical protein